MSRMRRGPRKLWWPVPCTSRKSLRTESRNDIEEILKAKLATIKEEPAAEVCEESWAGSGRRRLARKGKKMRIGSFAMPQFSLITHPYLVFTDGLARPTGLPQP